MKTRSSAAGRSKQHAEGIIYQKKKREREKIRRKRVTGCQEKTWPNGLTASLPYLSLCEIHTYTRERDQKRRLAAARIPVARKAKMGLLYIPRFVFFLSVFYFYFFGTSWWSFLLGSRRLERPPSPEEETMRQQAIQQEPLRRLKREEYRFFNTQHNVWSWWIDCTVQEKDRGRAKDPRENEKEKIPPSPLRVIREDWRPAGTIRGLLLLLFFSLSIFFVLCVQCVGCHCFLSSCFSHDFLLLIFRVLVWVYASEFQRRRARRGEERERERETASICRARNKLDTVSRHVSLRTSLFLLIKLFILTTTVMKEGLLRHSNKCNATGFSNTFLFHGMCCVSLSISRVKIDLRSLLYSINKKIEPVLRTTKSRDGWYFVGDMKYD